MYKNLLPIGSVVLLKGGQKRIMITGRIQTRAGETEIFDYSACYYPQGIVAPNQMFFFNRDAIDKVFFLGYQDGEEFHYRQEVLGKLGQLEVRDGRIVNKEETE